jgi:hypothetical protein
MIDWVDFKRHVIRYNKPYTDGYRQVHLLLAHVVESYSEYRSASIEGMEEYKCVDKYGVFLYYLAQLENMVHGSQCAIAVIDDNEWGMIGGACKIIRNYQNGSIDGEQLWFRAYSWIRAFYPQVYTSRIFQQSMVASVRSLSDKNGY